MAADHSPRFPFGAPPRLAPPRLNSPLLCPALLLQHLIRRFALLSALAPLLAASLPRLRSAFRATLLSASAFLPALLSFGAPRIANANDFWKLVSCHDRALTQGAPSNCSFFLNPCQHAYLCLDYSTWAAWLTKRASTFRGFGDLPTLGCNDSYKR